MYSSDEPGEHLQCYGPDNSTANKDTGIIIIITTISTFGS